MQHVRPGGRGEAEESGAKKIDDSVDEIRPATRGAPAVFMRLFTRARSDYDPPRLAAKNGRA